jgi:exopolysaccharide biosynthesis polyprenyl glycosylphosphotransferase
MGNQYGREDAWFHDAPAASALGGRDAGYGGGQLTPGEPGPLPRFTPAPTGSAEYLPPSSPITPPPAWNARRTPASFAATAYGPPGPIGPGAPIGPPPSAPMRMPASAASPAYASRIATPRPAKESEEEELQRHITTRMAMLTRDPQYEQMQRTLANRRRNRSRLYEFMFVLDLLLSEGALLVAQHYRELLHRLFDVNLYVHVFFLDDTVLLAVLVALIWPIIFSLFGLYQTSWLANRFNATRAMLAVGVASLVTSGFLYFLSSTLDRTRIFLICFTLLDALLLGGVRLVLRPLAARQKLRRRVLIVGTGRLAVDAAQTIAGRGRRGLELVGIVGPERDVLEELDAVDPEEDGRLYAMHQAWVNWRLGELRDVVRIVRDREVDLVLIALSPLERTETSWVVSSLAHLPVQLYVLPDVVSETAKTVTDSIDGMPVIGLTESGVTGWNLRIKRVIDLLICVPFLLLIWPVLVIIAILVRLDSPGPAIFAGERVGQHNRRFKMYKFRTMITNADKRAKDVAIRTERGLIHKQRNDPRVTRVGAFLRKTSLDELPQLFNVLKGDMSIVGPRPELPWIVERYRAWQYRRLLVPQGITGWWQVHGRSDRVLHLHTQDDIFYVRNYSIWLDIKILLMTIKVVFRGKGAF